MIVSETLTLLEWPRLCQHLSTFAATKLGAIAAQDHPIPDNLADSQQLLSQTEEICLLEEGLQGWSFDGVSDIGDALERAERGGLLSGEELLEIGTTLAGIRRLRRIIEVREDVPTLSTLVADIRTYPELEKEIHHCIDEDGKVADRATPKLGEIRHSLKSLRNQIQQKLQRIIQVKGNAIQEPVVTKRSDRFVIPVKASHKDQIKGIVHDSSSTGATLYVEPNSVIEWGNKLRQAIRRERTEEEVILRKLSYKIAELFADLEYLLAVATDLDLATARARYSLWLNAYPPKFINLEGNKEINLRQLRHPLLIWQQKHEQGETVVPVDVQIRHPIKVVAITGPNTGGKTVTLKTIGLAALMAKIGLFIPAKEPIEMPWFEKILADIGDEQSIEQSLSTFSGHIRRITRIIDALKPKDPSPVSNISPQGETLLTPNPSPQKIGEQQALVLLDEVGAGTDPAEGSALAIALLKYLADNAQLTIATTHYGELKSLKYQDPRFENASVEFNDQTLSPTYRLLWGIPGRSNALTIAQRLGLDDTIIAEAKNHVGGFSQEINEVIAGLEAQKREQEQKAAEARQLLQKTEHFYQEVSDKATNLKDRERSLKQYQEMEVQKAINEAKAEIAQVIRQLQQGEKTGQKAQKATESLNQIADKQQPIVKPSKPTYLPQIGEKIRIPSLGQTAEVLEMNEEGNSATVRFGIMKMTVNLGEIESLDGKKVEITAPSPPPKSSKPPTPSKPSPVIRTSQNTLDIRGQRVAESEADLENAIAKATESGVLWIIHGKGTGKLRAGVHEFLQRHPQVTKFELASQKEGGSGVTIAYLN
ncbi:MAG: endonuclease MutS2 [Microcystaceae cyanobacterium]